MLLPLDAVAVITYAKGYYRITDMLLPGAIISVVWVILMTALMVGVAPLLGLLWSRTCVVHDPARREARRRDARGRGDLFAKPGSSRGSAAGTAERQPWVADMADAGVFGERDAARGDWRREADRVQARS